MHEAKEHPYGESFPGQPGKAVPIVPRDGEPIVICMTIAAIPHGTDHPHPTANPYQIRLYKGCRGAVPPKRVTNMIFEQYLRNAVDKGIQELRLVPIVRTDGSVTFYIHPIGQDGITQDYWANDNTLIPVENALNGPPIQPEGTL